MKLTDRGDDDQFSRRVPFSSGIDESANNNASEKITSIIIIIKI